MKFATKAIHAGIEPDPSTGAVMTPIYQTSTYAQAAPGDHKGYEYARTQNPTRSVLEKNLAALENGTEAICFSSGLAAQDAVIKLLSAGDEVLAVNDLYGGSYRQMVRIWGQWGLKSRFVDMYTASNVEREISPSTKLILRTLGCWPRRRKTCRSWCRAGKILRWEISSQAIVSKEN